jgi:hypothetical protein
MHAGRLDNDSAAARTYRALLDQLGDWVDAGWLARTVGSDAIGTRVSEVRHAVGSDTASPYVVDPCRTVWIRDEAGRLVPRQNYRLRLRAERPAPAPEAPVEDAPPDGELFAHPRGNYHGQ